MTCTCGQCLGGVLSPKTAYLVRTSAETAAEILNDTLPSWPPGDQAVHDPQAYLFDFVPPELRVEVVRPFVVGFANCMSTVAYCIKQGMLPKPRVVGQCATIVPGLDKSASKLYLDRGGMPEYALDAVLARAEEEAGDGSFAGDEDNVKKLEALPACANDDKFELLRQKLFQNSDFWPCGPYEEDGVIEEDVVYYS